MLKYLRYTLITGLRVFFKPDIKDVRLAFRVDIKRVRFISLRSADAVDYQKIVESCAMTHPTPLEANNAMLNTGNTSTADHPFVDDGRLGGLII